MEEDVDFDASLDEMQYIIQALLTALRNTTHSLPREIPERVFHSLGSIPQEELNELLTSLGVQQPEDLPGSASASALLHRLSTEYTSLRQFASRIRSDPHRQGNPSESIASPSKWKRLDSLEEQLSMLATWLRIPDLELKGDRMGVPSRRTLALSPANGSLSENSPLLSSSIARSMFGNSGSREMASIIPMDSVSESRSVPVSPRELGSSRGVNGSTANSPGDPEQFRKLRIQNEELRAMHNEITSELLSVQMECEELRLESSTLRDEAQDLRNRCLKYQRAVEEAQEKYSSTDASLQKTKRELSEALHDSERKIRQLEEQLSKAATAQTAAIESDVRKKGYEFFDALRAVWNTCAASVSEVSKFPLTSFEDAEATSTSIDIHPLCSALEDRLSRFTQLEASLRESDASLSRAANYSNELESRIDKWKIQEEELRAQIRKERDATEEIERDRRTMIRRFDESQAEIRKLRSELENSVHDRDIKIQTLRSDIESLTQRNQSLEQTLASLRKNSSELRDVQHEGTLLKSEIASLGLERDRFREESRCLENQLTELRTQYSEVYSHLEDERSRRASQESEMRSLVESLNRSRTSLVDVEKQLRDAIEENSILRQRLAVVRDSAQSLEAKSAYSASLNSDLSRLHDQRNSLEKRVSSLEADLSVAEDEVNRLRTDADHHRKRAERLETELISTERDNQRLLARLQIVENGHVSQLESSGVLERRFKDLEEELESVRGAHHRAIEERVELEKKSRELEESLETQVRAQRLAIENLKSVHEDAILRLSSDFNKKIMHLSESQSDLLSEHSHLTDQLSSIEHKCETLWESFVELQRSDQELFEKLGTELEESEGRATQLDSTVHTLSEERSKALQYLEVFQREHEYLVDAQKSFFEQRQSQSQLLSEFQQHLTSLQTEHLQVCSDLKRVNAKLSSIDDSVQDVKNEGMREMNALKRVLEDTEGIIRDQEFIETRLAPHKLKAQEDYRAAVSRAQELELALSQAQESTRELSTKLSGSQKRLNHICRLSLLVRSLFLTGPLGSSDGQVGLDIFSAPSEKSISMGAIELSHSRGDLSDFSSFSSQQHAGEESMVLSSPDDFFENEILLPMRQLFKGYVTMREKLRSSSEQFMRSEDQVLSLTKELQEWRKKAGILERQVESLDKLGQERNDLLHANRHHISSLENVSLECTSIRDLIRENDEMFSRIESELRRSDSLISEVWSRFSSRGTELLEFVDSLVEVHRAVVGNLTEMIQARSSSESSLSSKLSRVQNTASILQNELRLRESDVMSLENTVKMLEAEVERQRKDSIRSLEGLTQMLDSIRERGDRLSMSATQWEAQSNKLRVDLENESRLRREVERHRDSLSSDLEYAEKRCAQLNQSNEEMKEAVRHVEGELESENEAVRRQYSRLMSLMEQSTESWNQDLQSLRSEHKQSATELQSIRESLAFIQDESKRLISDSLSSVDLVQQELVALETRGKEYFQSLRTVEGERNRLETQYLSVRSTLEDRESELSRIRVDLSDRDHRLSLSEEECSSLRRQLQAIQGDFGSGKEEYQKLMAEVRRLHEEISVKDSTIRNLERLSDEAQSKISLLETKIRNMGEERNRIIEENSATTQILEKRFVDEKEEWKTEILRMQGELHKRDAHVQKMELDLQKSLDERKHLEDRLSSLVESLNEVETRKKMVESSWEQRLESLHSNLYREREEIQQELISVTKNLRNAKIELDERRAQAELFEKNLAEESDALESLKRESHNHLSDLRGRVQDLTQEVESLSDKCRELETEKKQSSKQLRELEELVTEKDREISRLRSEKDAVDARMGGLTSDEVKQRMTRVRGDINLHRAQQSFVPTTPLLPGGVSTTQTSSRPQDDDT